MDPYVKDTAKANFRIIIIGIGAVIFIFVALASIFAFPTDHFPADGDWYCTALGMQISFEKSGESFLIRNNDKIVCSVVIERGSKWIHVTCQATDNTYFDLGNTVFFGEITRRKDDSFIIRGDNGISYTFTRIN